jgi:transcriptional regulator with XRE-family HTH domain
MPRIKTDQERGYVAAWMRRERSARGWSQKDMPSRLATVGFPVEADYYRQIEAGPKMPGPDFLGALKRLYGSEPEPLPAPQSSDGLAELAAAIREQNEVSRQMAMAVADLALALHRTRSEAPQWFLERGDEWTTQVLETIRLAVGGEAAAGLSGFDAPRRGKG